jgi:hypothetical protein
MSAKQTRRRGAHVDYPLTLFVQFGIREEGGLDDAHDGVVLASYPCRPHAVRGLRAVVVTVDEVAFFRDSENNPVDREMLRAVRPCLATTNARLVILSSPYGQAGALSDLHRRHFGRDDAPMLVWQASKSGAKKEAWSTDCPAHQRRVHRASPQYGVHIMDNMASISWTNSL